MVHATKQAKQTLHVILNGQFYYMCLVIVEFSKHKWTSYLYATNAGDIPINPGMWCHICRGHSNQSRHVMSHMQGTFQSIQACDVTYVQTFSLHPPIHTNNNNNTNNNNWRVRHYTVVSNWESGYMWTYVCHFCTLTLAYFCVSSVFDPVPNFTKQNPSV